MCYCSYLILSKFKCCTIYENRVRSYPLCREGKKIPATGRRKGAKGTQLNDATDSVRRARDAKNRPIKTREKKK